MSKVTFYVQKRTDNGKRIGLLVDGETLFQRFEAGKGDWDPGLAWFVDLRCEGETIPAQADEARDWLLSRADLFAKELTLFANDLTTGIDPDVWPVQRRIASGLPGLRMEIVSSAMRRIEPEELAQAMRGIASGLKQEIAELPPLEKAS